MIRFLRAAAVAAPVLAAVALAVPAASASTAAAPPAPLTATFSATIGGHAGWAPGDKAIDLYVTGTPATANAIVQLHGFAATLPTAEPSFKTTNYASGTPRIYVAMSDGKSIFVYPDGTTGNGASNGWAAFVNGESGTGATVKEVDVIADGSQPLPADHQVSDITYGGQTLTAAPNVITARYICGPWNKTHWSVFNAAGGRTVGVSVRVFIQRTGKWAWVTHLYRRPGQFGAVWTYHGNQLNVSYADGYGHWANFTATVPARRACK